MQVRPLPDAYENCKKSLDEVVKYVTSLDETTQNVIDKMDPQEIYEYFYEDLEETGRTLLNNIESNCEAEKFDDIIYDYVGDKTLQWFEHNVVKKVAIYISEMTGGDCKLFYEYDTTISCKFGPDAIDKPEVILPPEKKIQQMRLIAKKTQQNVLTLQNLDYEGDVPPKEKCPEGVLVDENGRCKCPEGVLVDENGRCPDEVIALYENMPPNSGQMYITPEGTIAYYD